MDHPQRRASGATWFRRLDPGAVENLPVTRRAALSLVGVVIQGLVRFVYSVLIGRLLTPALLAATNSAISLALFTSLLWPTATASAASKFVSRARGQGDDALAAASATYLARISLWTALVLAVGAGGFSYFFQARHDAVAALLVAALVVAWAGYTFVRGVYFAVNQVARATAWDAISALLAIALLVVVIVLGAHAVLLLPLTLGYALYAVVGWPRAHRSAALTPTLRREMNRFTAWTMVGTLASTGLLQLSMVIANAVGEPDAAGAYAAALSLATPASMVARSLSLVLFPAMAHAGGRADHAGLRRQTDLSTRGLVATMGAIFGALAITSQLIIVVVFGERYAAGGPILVTLLAAGLLVTINVGAVNSLSAGTEHGVRIVAVSSALGMVVGLASMALLVAATGVLGVATGYLIGTVLIGLGPLAVVWVRSRMRWAGLFGRALIGAGVATLILALDEMLALDPWWSLIGAAVFGAVWVPLMWPEVRVLNSLRHPKRPGTPSAVERIE